MAPLVVLLSSASKASLGSLAQDFVWDSQYLESLPVVQAATPLHLDEGRLRAQAPCPVLLTVPLIGFLPLSTCVQRHAFLRQLLEV